jgi:hypothetical protein
MSRPGITGYAQPISADRQEAFRSRIQAIPSEIIKPPAEHKIVAIVCMWNEAVFIPFFLKHYWFVDTIFVLLGKGDDNSEERLRADSRVMIRPLDMPNGFDDGLKIDAMNNTLAECRKLGVYDWVLMLDADEFIFPPGDPGCAIFKQALSRVGRQYNAVNCYLRNVYRHTTDIDLDPTLPGPVVHQRRHGSLKIIPGYVKPNVARIRDVIRFGPGHHTVEPNRVSRSLRFFGAHWQNADQFAIRRRVDYRMKRLSEHEIKRGWGTGNWDLTYEKVAQELRDHLNDPLII